MILDPDRVMSVLAKKRPVFHSEADFQFAFAWTAKDLDPLLEVRLETHPEPNVRVDVLLERRDLARRAVIELKYMTRLWAGTWNGEVFAVKNHGAHDVRCYDVVKDVARVERFIDGRSDLEGHVIALSNDASYWRPPGHTRRTNADDFRLHEGRRLEGVREWGPRTGAGTSKGRENPIALRGSYQLEWRDYARLDATPSGTLRSLCIQIDDQAAPSAPANPSNAGTRGLHD